MNSRPRLLMWFGFGMPPGMLERQKALPLRLETPAWIEPVKGEPIASYAARLVGTIEISEDLYVGGVSFGAMVAMEVARIIRPRGLFIIAGCRSSDAIPGYLRTAAKFASHLPRAAISQSWRFTRLGLALMGERLDAEGFATLTQTVARVSPSVAKWGLDAVTRWRPDPNSPCPVYQIHGANDRLVDSNKCGAEVILPSAGHLLNWECAAEVNAFISARLQETTNAAREDLPSSDSAVRNGSRRSGDLRYQ